MVGCMRQVERLVGALGEGVDWTARIKALLRLEGLAAGAATGGLAGALPDALRPLRDPLAAQLLDRRSAVARQARPPAFPSPGGGFCLYELWALRLLRGPLLDRRSAVARQARPPSLLENEDLGSTTSRVASALHSMY